MSRGVLAAHGTTTDAGNGDWRHQAACLETDPELFWPIGDTEKPGPAADQAAEAKTWCATCPVWSECRDFAMASSQVEGVWGGLTGAEMIALRRRNSRARAAGAPPPPPPPLVPMPLRAAADPVRDIVRDLRNRGWSFMRIAEGLDVGESTARDIAAGSRKYVTQRVAAAANALLVGAE